ncbi:hypothetical protein [Haloprofundus salilacus]|uniref:hypothetical protein n=1 Tax=Haloprofundus salilacus TaxID=2876190 RepID=UPI001CCD23F6|nr:hypothetical protein [Haloprofundus salilacus]
MSASTPVYGLTRPVVFDGVHAPDFVAVRRDDGLADRFLSDVLHSTKPYDCERFIARFVTKSLGAESRAVTPWPSYIIVHSEASFIVGVF